MCKDISAELQTNLDPNDNSGIRPMIHPLEIEQSGDFFFHDKKDACKFSECKHKEKLKETLSEAIEVLERTKQAFKSKQLETLRKKFIRVLIDEI